MPTDLAELRRKADAFKAKHDHACRAVSEEGSRLTAAENRVAAAEEARTVIQHVAQAVQQNAHAKIASVVTCCLAGVFDDPYGFNLRFERRRGKTECDLKFTRGGEEFHPAEEGESFGGAVDVASLALRLSCLMLTRPRARRLLVMDEPCKNVNGKGNQSRVCEMVETLSRDMKVQMILVSDNWLRAGEVVRLGEG